MLNVSIGIGVSPRKSPSAPRTPSSVRNFRKTGGSAGQFSYAFDPPSAGVTPFTYKVEYRKTGDGSYTLFVNNTTNRTGTITGLTDGSTYNVRVTATNSLGDGNASVFTGITTGDNGVSLSSAMVATSSMITQLRVVTNASVSASMLSTSSMVSMLSAVNAGASNLSSSMTSTSGMSALLSSIASSSLASSMTSTSSMSSVVTATAGGGAMTFTDDFNRADQTLVTSPNWTSVSGNTASLNIVSNQLATNANEGAYWSPDMGSPNQYVEALISATGTSVGPFLVCRLVDQNNWGIAVRFNTSTGAMQAWKRVSGALSQIGSSSTNNATQGNIIRLEAVGTEGRLVVNGAIASGIITLDNNGAGQTRQGIVSRTNAQNPWIDNYKTGTITTLTS